MAQQQRAQSHQQALDRDTNLIVRALNEKLAMIDQYIEILFTDERAMTAARTELSRQLGWLREAFGSLKRDIKAFFLGPDSTLGLAAVTTYGTVVQTPFLASTDGPGGGDGGDIFDDIRDKIVTYLKSVGADLFKILSKLLNVTAWSLSGEIGQSLFGLSGSVSLGLTFGK